MVSVLLGAAAGAAVCAFGMWAFLKGQRSMLEIRSGGLPSGLLERKAAPDGLAKQFAALFAEQPERK